MKDHGGTVQKSVGKRLDYVVVGAEPGPSKMATVEKYGIKVLNEEGLFDLIRTLPAKPFATCKRRAEVCSVRSILTDRTKKAKRVGKE